jgi:transposase-like protein
MTTKGSKMTYQEWQAKFMPKDVSSTYPQEKRLQVISDYLLSGNLAEVSRKHDIPYVTLVTWKDADWWVSAAEDMLQNYKEELKAKQRKILDRTYSELEDRLDNGDEIFDKEHGHVRIKVRANHLAAIADTTLKANQLLSNLPTQITNVNIDSLADKLRDITLKAKDITPKPESLEVKFKEITSDQNQEEP